MKLGRDVKLSSFINLYGCEIGDETKIGAFVEIQKNATVGKRCKISSHTFICEGVTIEDNVFIGHGVTFINDSYPRAANVDGSLQTEADWKVEKTVVKKGASIGSGSTILSGVTIGENAIVGAGSVVTKMSRQMQLWPAILQIAAVRGYRQSTRSGIMSVGDIPFLDLVTPHQELEQNCRGISRLATAGFIGGPMVEEFEKEFAAYCGSKFCVGVGTERMRFDLRLWPPACRPATPSLPFPTHSSRPPRQYHKLVRGQTSSTSTSVRTTWTRRSCGISGEEMHAQFRPRRYEDGAHVTAVVPVHLYGQMATWIRFWNSRTEFG